MKKEGKGFKRYTITSALPYANGPLHIGHIAGVYLPADIYTRYMRLKGKNIIHICGSDEHGVPITLKARNEGVDPQVIVDRYHELNKKSFEKFGVTFDHYSRTSAEIHHKTASDFFLDLHKKDLFEEKETEQYFDEEVQEFLADRYIIGTCPNCGYENAYGDQCEKCGTSLSPRELKEPRSALSGQQPVLKKTRHWFLPLDKIQEEWLEEWILNKEGNWKPNVFGQCKSWLDGGLQPRAVTRDLKWGVNVPLENAKSKVLYVWFDAPIGYISATKEWAEENGKEWAPYWQNEDTRLIHFIGKDNIVFHCIIFPAMLQEHGEYILPDNVPSNEFLNLEGNKLSTSRNWAVWLHEYLEEFPGKQDELRYVLCANMPETKDNDFTWKDYQNRVNNELVAVLGNFVNRSIVLTHKYFDGKVPEFHAQDTDDITETLLDEMQAYPDAIGDSIEKFRFREALGYLMNIARIGNKYLTEKEPWKIIKDDEKEVKKILHVSLQIVAHLAVLSEPFMPFMSAKLKKAINLPEDLGWDNMGKKVLPAGHPMGKPGLLFEKVEDKIIQTQLDKLKSGSDTAEKKTKKEKPAIEFDDFMKMDIRIATILQAEKVKKADKLLKIELDTGTEKRTVVSGIAQHYSPEEITGKKVLLLANLQPRKIMGIRSQGMILMAEDAEGNLKFVAPDGEIGNGAVVR